MKIPHYRPGIRWVVLQLLERCNLRCEMCYEWGSTGSYHERNGRAVLDFSVLERIVKDCLPGKPLFEFFGGEPLLYPRIADAIRLVRAGDCQLVIPTNGVLVDKYAEMLVETAPTQLWISLDGPERINDLQRGEGVFRKALDGLHKLHGLREARGQRYPEIGVTFVVTPANHTRIEEFFFESIPLAELDHVSIELQCFATQAEVEAYKAVLSEKFDQSGAPCAQGYVSDPAAFEGMDHEAIARQMMNVKRYCRQVGIVFISHPMTIEAGNIQNYFAARREQMSDYRRRCPFPWTYVEIAANGDVVPCHSFYDHAIGNVHQQGILEIWNGERMKRLRSHLRRELFPICPACCRYYNNPKSSTQLGE